MSLSRTDDVFALIRSMTKSEKRAFRLFAERIQERDTLQYMKLFDILDKQLELDEAAIKRHLGNLSSGKYSNLKRHLYKQILVSVRHLSVDKLPNIKMREHIDFAYVLYGKGLYMHALKMLEKARKLAERHHFDFNLLNIYEIEKMIHSRHITRTDSSAIQSLLDLSEMKINALSHRVVLSNLRVSMHAFYVANGHVKNEKEEQKVKVFFASKLPDIDIETLGQTAKLHLFQAYVWYYYTLNDFENCLVYARLWVELFKSDKELLHSDIDLFFRGYHYLLTAAFNLRKVSIYKTYLVELDDFRKKYYARFFENTKIISFIYVHTGRMNGHFLEGTFDEGVKSIKRTQARMKRYHDKLDEHKIMVLYYKMAWMYLANNQPQQSVIYLQNIIEMTNISLRKDIQSYARLMSLMAHYDLENVYLLNSLLRSYGNFFKKHELEMEMQYIIVRFFKTILKSPILQRKDVFEDYLQQLKDLQSQKYESRAFLYLDVNIWMQAKIDRTSIHEIVKQQNS